MQLGVRFACVVVATAGLVAMEASSWAQSAACTGREQQSCASELAACDTSACQSIHACLISSRCVSGGDATFCHCGTSGAACVNTPGAANGPCVSVMQAHIPPAQIPLILANPGQFPTSPVTRAVALGVCAEEHCAAPCAVAPVPALPRVWVAGLLLLLAAFGSVRLFRHREQLRLNNTDSPPTADL